MTLSLPALPYALDALEPHISRKTMAVHHGRHHAAYVEKTRALVQRTPLETASLRDIVIASSRQDARLFNAAAQAWNHEFFWNGMSPGGGGPARGAIAGYIERSFGSQSTFNQQFVSAASEHFGSGWVWLVLDRMSLRILSTHDADTPLVQGLTPLLALDVWEHAYYLDYEHRRLDFIAAFLAHLVDWDAVNRRLASSSQDATPPYQCAVGGACGG
jgi:superoxide dismutase, Fe-Mn family